MIPKNNAEEIKTKAVISFGSQSYKEAKFTLAIASGIISSINITPFTIGFSGIKESKLNATRGKMMNLNDIIQRISFLLTSLILVP